MPSTAPAAAVSRQWFDCAAPTVTRERAPALDRIAAQELQLANLVATHHQAGQVVALDPQPLPAGQLWPTLERCRQQRQGSTGEVTEHGPHARQRDRDDGLEPDPPRRVRPAVLEGPAGLRRRRASTPHGVPTARSGVCRPAPDVVRRHTCLDPRAGSVPRKGAGPRVVLLGAARGRDPALARQHPRRARVPTSASSRPTTATSRPGRVRVSCCSTPRSRSVPGRPPLTTTRAGRRSPIR